MKIEECETVDFMGGLGDVIHRCFKTLDYAFLDSITDPVNILMGSKNPFCQELFFWHPKRELMRIFQLWPLVNARTSAGIPAAQVQKEMFEFVGIPFEKQKNRWRKSDEFVNPMFYPSKQLKAPSKSIVIHPGAGGAIRQLPASMISQIAIGLAEADWNVTVISRTEAPPLYLRHDNIEIVCHWPVPDTLAFLDQANTIIGAHSSMTQYGWFRNIPTFVLWPDDNHEWNQKEHHFTWGKDKFNSKNSSFKNYNFEKIASFVESFGHQEKKSPPE